MRNLVVRSCLLSSAVAVALMTSQGCGPTPTGGTGGGTGGSTGGGSGGGATGGGTGGATGGGTGGSATGGGTGGAATGGGTGGAATGGGTGAIDAGPPITFTTVYTTIIANRCAPCHTTSTGIGVTQGMLDMTTQANAYTNLVNTAAAGSACSGHGTRVVPNQPDSSILYLKISLDDPSPCGAKMPFGLAPLPQSEVTSIQDWILQGAKND
jgi:hypothetical protein